MSGFGKTEQCKETRIKNSDANTRANLLQQHTNKLLELAAKVLKQTAAAGASGDQKVQVDDSRRAEQSAQIDDRRQTDQSAQVDDSRQTDQSVQADDSRQMDGARGQAAADRSSILVQHLKISDVDAGVNEMFYTKTKKNVGTSRYLPSIEAPPPVSTSPPPSRRTRSSRSSTTTTPQATKRTSSSSRLTTPCNKRHLDTGPSYKSRMAKSPKYGYESWGQAAPSRAYDQWIDIKAEQDPTPNAYEPYSTPAPSYPEAMPVGQQQISMPPPQPIQTPPPIFTREDTSMLSLANTIPISSTPNVAAESTDDMVSARESTQPTRQSRRKKRQRKAQTPPQESDSFVTAKEGKQRSKKGYTTVQPPCHQSWCPHIPKKTTPDPQPPCHEPWCPHIPQKRASDKGPEGDMVDMVSARESAGPPPAKSLENQLKHDKVSLVKHKDNERSFTEARLSPSAVPKKVESDSSFKSFPASTPPKSAAPTPKKESKRDSMSRPQSTPTSKVQPKVSAEGLAAEKAKLLQHAAAEKKKEPPGALGVIQTKKPADKPHTPWTRLPETPVKPQLTPEQIKEAEKKAAADKIEAAKKEAEKKEMEKKEAEKKDAEKKELEKRQAEQKEKERLAAEAKAKADKEKAEANRFAQSPAGSVRGSARSAPGTPKHVAAAQLKSATPSNTPSSREQHKKAAEGREARLKEEEARVAKKKEADALAAKKKEEDELAAKKKEEALAAKKKEEDALAAKKKEEELVAKQKEEAEKIKKALEKQPQTQEHPCCLHHPCCVHSKEPAMYYESWLKKKQGEPEDKKKEPPPKEMFKKTPEPKPKPATEEQKRAPPPQAKEQDKMGKALDVSDKYEIVSYEFQMNLVPGKMPTLVPARPPIVTPFRGTIPPSRFDEKRYGTAKMTPDSVFVNDMKIWAAPLVM